MQGNSFFGFSGGGGGTPPPTNDSWLLDGNTNGAEKYFGTNDNFSIPIYTNGAAIGIFLNTGDFGFGTIAPTSKLHVKGIDATSSNYALKVDDSASSALFYVRNDGASFFNNKSFINYNSSAFQSILQGSTFSTLTDNINILAGISSPASARFRLSYYGNTQWLTALDIQNSGSSFGNLILMPDGGNIGIGIIAPTSKLHVKGIDSISSNYALKVDNSASSPLLYVRNDGLVGVGASNTNLFETFNIYKFNTAVSSSLAYNTTNRAVTFLTPNASASYGISSIYDDKLVFGRFNVSGTANGFGFVCGVNGDFTLNADYYTGTPAVDFIYKATSRNIGIRTYTPTAALHLTGQDSTSSNYALKIDNSASSPLLYVRNDGVVSINSNQTVNNSQLVINSSNVEGISFLNYGLGNQQIYFDAVFKGGNIIANNTTALGINNYNGQLRFNGATGLTVGNSFSYSTLMLLDSLSGNLSLGLGASVGLARFHVFGVDSTSSNYALKVDNSASSPLLYVRNDGNVGIGKTNPSAKVDILQNTVSTGAKAISINFNTIGEAFYMDDNGTIQFKTQAGVNITNSGAINLIAAGSNPFIAFKVNNGANTSGNLFGDNLNMFLQPSKYFGISSTYFNASASLQVRGEDSTSSNYSLKIENSATSPLLYVRNDGAIGVNVSSPLARFHNFGLNNSINLRLEPVADVTEDTTGGTVQTIDNTSNVTAQTISIPTDKVVSIESTIVYRKTSGAGVGNTGDGTTIKLNSSVKNIGGTLTLDTIQNTYTGTLNAIVGVSATYTISGANISVSVTGVANDNITWNVITKVNTVS